MTSNYAAILGGETHQALRREIDGTERNALRQYHRARVHACDIVLEITLKPEPDHHPPPLAIFEADHFTPNEMGGQPTPLSRIPSSKAEQVHAPRSTNRPTHSASCPPPPPPPPPPRALVEVARFGVGGLPRNLVGTSRRVVFVAQGLGLGLWYGP